MMLLNCGVGEDSWESLGLQGDLTSQSYRKSVLKFIGRTDAETETPILWPPDANWFIGKNPDTGKDWRQEEKGTTEDEMIGSYHQLDEFEQASVFGDKQGSLAVHGVTKSRTQLSDWSEVAITKYHRLVQLNTTEICFSLSGGWKLRSGYQYSWVLVRAFFWTAECYLAVSSHGRMELREFSEFHSWLYPHDLVTS